MSVSRKFHFTSVALVLWLATLPAFGLHGHEATAQTRYADVPILVVAEDENTSTARRSNELAKRVVAALKSGMSRAGFRVIEEEAVAGDLKWTIKDRRPKIELFQLVKLMVKSGKAEHQVRALVLYRTYPNITHLQSGDIKVSVRIACEIHDLQSNQFLTSIEVKSPVRMLPPQGGGCDEACVFSAVGESAARAAGSLGALLAQKLALYRDVSAGGKRGRASGSGHTMQIPYTVTLRYFKRREALAIVGVMAEEFPGYKTHTLISQEPAVRRYSYITSAKPGKMEEWLTILLRDMNFDPEKEVVTHIKGNGITIEKILPTPDRPKSKDEKKFMK